MINYKDYLNSKNKSITKNIYIKSFPKNERLPFWILKNSAKSTNVIFNEITVDNETIGLTYIITYKDIAYLMYFAIKEDKRNKNYGSLVLKELIDQYKTVVLSIEKINEKDDISKRRKQFYLRNGFFEINKFTEQNNVYYELLCSNKDYNLTKDELVNIYKNMTNSKMIGYFINKRFKLFDVNFIDGGENENIYSKAWTSSS